MDLFNGLTVPLTIERSDATSKNRAVERVHVQKGYTTSVASEGIDVYGYFVRESGSLDIRRPLQDVQ